MNSSDNYRGVDTLILPDGRFKVHLINTWQPNAIAVESGIPLSKDAWNHVVVAYDGSSKAAGVKIFVNGRGVETRTVVDALRGPIETSTPFKLGLRENADGLKGQLAGFRLFDQAFTDQQAEAAMKADVIGQLDRIAASKTGPHGKARVDYVCGAGRKSNSAN